jgi:integrase
MLTEVQIRNAKPSKKIVRLFDGYGMYLEVMPSGSKWWRQKYRHAGKEKRISLGVYPEVSLKGARARRDDTRRVLAAGIDPSEHRKAVRNSQIERAGNSFEVVAREWIEKFSRTWANGHAKRIMRRLEKDVFPWLGGRPIAEIKAMELLATIRKLENRGVLETAHRTLATCGQIFRYAVATGRAERDPSGDLRGALTPVKGEHFAAVTDPKKVGQLLRVFDGYDGSLVVQSALKLAPLVFVRPGELRMAQWAHIDFEAAEWRYTVSKTGTEHVVPLAKQAIDILKTLQGLTGRGQYVFPSGRSPRRPMSDNAILAAMRRMGIGKEEMSGHGFRAMARTILDEVLKCRPDLIEHQLAHTVRDPLGRAYNRTTHLPERREMMQRWADCRMIVAKFDNRIPQQFACLRIIFRFPN